MANEDFPALPGSMGLGGGLPVQMDGKGGMEQSMPGAHLMQVGRCSRTNYIVAPSRRRLLDLAIIYMVIIE